jgi:transcriptional regulator with XRE-family HTH domain
MRTLARAQIASSIDNLIACSAATQEQLARALGTSTTRLSAYRSGATEPGAAIYLLLGQVIDAQRWAANSNLHTVDATSREVNANLNDTDWCIRLIQQSRDHLKYAFDMSEGGHLAWTIPARKPIKSERLHVLYAALTAREFTAQELEAPPWTEGLTLSEPWVLSHPFYSDTQICEEADPALTPFGIFARSRDLVTA